MKYCSKCGEQNPDEAKFCGKCGASLPVPVTAQLHSSNETVVSPETRIGITILSIFIPLVGIIMGILYMNDSNPSKKAAGKTWLYVSLGVIIAYCLIYSVLAGAAANSTTDY